MLENDIIYVSNNFQSNASVIAREMTPDTEGSYSV